MGIPSSGSGSKMSRCIRQTIRLPIPHSRRPAGSPLAKADGRLSRVLPGDMSAERWRGVPLDLYLENEGEVVVFDPVSWRTHLLSHVAFGLVRHLRSHPASIDELLKTLASRTR